MSSPPILGCCIVSLFLLCSPITAIDESIATLAPSVEFEERENRSIHQMVQCFQDEVYYDFPMVLDNNDLQVTMNIGECNNFNPYCITFFFYDHVKSRCANMWEAYSVLCAEVFGPPYLPGNCVDYPVAALTSEQMVKACCSRYASFQQEIASIYNITFIEGNVAMWDPNTNQNKWKIEREKKEDDHLLIISGCLFGVLFLFAAVTSVYNWLQNKKINERKLEQRNKTARSRMEYLKSDRSLPGAKYERRRKTEAQLRMVQL